jgi:hypothetical protein
MTKALLLLPLLLSTSFSSYAFLNLGKETPDSSALTSVISEKLSNTQSQSPLTDALTSNLSISGNKPQQARQRCYLWLKINYLQIKAKN